MGDLDIVGKWLVWPKFREEGPPKYLRALLYDTNLPNEVMTKDAVRRIGYLILLGYRPATVIGIANAFLENGNKPLYGAALGKVLEQKYGLAEGQYTKGRYYEDRISKIVDLLSALGILKEETTSVAGTEKSTPGFRLAPPYYQLLKAMAQRGELPMILDFNPYSPTIKVCQRNHFITLDVSAEYCQTCGIRLSLACSNCGRMVVPGNAFCVACGQRIAS